jgi:hypothetical protein
MVRITGEYQGDLHCSAVHGPSGNALATDAPKDNQGRGEAFSPTDLGRDGLRDLHRDDDGHRRAQARRRTSRAFDTR